MQRFWGQLSSLDSVVQAVGSYAKQAVQSFEQDEQQEKEVDPSLLPWHLPPEYQEKEAYIKKQVLLLSEEKWNFLEPPNAGNLLDWEWEFDAEQARACLQADPKLDRLRFLLVPYKMKEEDFWRNYFARVHLIKRSILDPNIRFSHNEKSKSPTASPVLSPYIKKASLQPSSAQTVPQQTTPQQSTSQQTPPQHTTIEPEQEQPLWRMESPKDALTPPIEPMPVQEKESPAPVQDATSSQDASPSLQKATEISRESGRQKEAEALQAAEEPADTTIATESEVLSVVSAPTPAVKEEAQKALLGEPKVAPVDDENMSLAEELGLDDLGIDLDDVDLSSMDLTGDPDIDELLDL